MKQVKEVDFFCNIKEVREFVFGVFYFFDGMVIAEIKEGVNFDWKKSRMVIQVSEEILGHDNIKVFISNRVNNYTVNPSHWLNCYRHKTRLPYYVIVGPSKNSFSNVVVEQLLLKGVLHQFTDLEEAIAWGLTKLKSKPEYV